MAGVVARFPAWHTHPDAWALMGAIEIAYLFAVRRRGASRRQITLISCGVGVLLLASALLMWLPICSPLPEVSQARPPTKMLYLFLQTIVPTVPASFLTFGTSPLYHFYEHVPRLWGISALTDMQMAGLIMKIVG